MTNPNTIDRSRLVAIGLVVVGMMAQWTVAAEVTVEGRKFTIIDGFTITRVAGAPLVDRPITAAFDDEGRLYVADSSGSNDNVQKQLADKPHRIVRLEDTNGDGKFDTQVIFADKFMFPEGTMWHAGSLYVAAPPSIWKLTDTNGDGIADERVEWFKGKTLTNCANDLHGPYPGIDGWIYWCKGAFAEQTYDRPGKSAFVTKAAHIFRARPDGTNIEPVMTGGMDNPVDVVFTPGGERIFTTTFLVNPSGGQRDGLIHAIYGGIYGKLHAPIYQSAHKWTGPDTMPVLLHMGPAAPCGLTRYESAAFGPAYQDNVFACYFNLHKVGRHVILPEGATFATRDDDFVSSPDLDFHPTDIIEDADGSLLIVDTGGWYKLCCPTSQLHKPDVLGGIYRVKRRAGARVADPWGKRLRSDGLRLTVEDLIRLLRDRRPAVRHQAIEALAKRANEERAHGDRSQNVVLDALRKNMIVPAMCSVEERRNMVWTLTRIDSAEARAFARVFLEDTDETVRQAAIHTASAWRDKDAASKLIGILGSPSLQNRRASAEALGRIGDKQAVPALLAAGGEPVDRVLEHSLTYALIEIADPAGTSAGLSSDNPRTARVAMIALDQMDGGKLEPERIAQLLASKEPILKETAVWITGRHPDWAGSLAGVLGDRLVRTDLTAADRAELERQLGRFAHSAPIQELLARLATDAHAMPAARKSCLQAMSWSGLKEKEIPASWISALSSNVSSDSVPELIPVAVAAIRSLPINKDKAGDLAARLLTVARNDQAAAELRLNALASLPGGMTDPDEKLFAFLTTRINRDQPVGMRTTAADVLARAKLRPEQLDRLADTLLTAGPVEVDRLLVAFEQSTDEKLGLKLVATLARSPALASLRIDALKSHLAKYGPAVQKEAEGLYARLNADAAKQKARLEQMLAALSAGDIRRGQLVFHSEKAACYSCHAIGYRGGNVGPDLTKIGSVRADRDLLEAILYPSASFVRSFEPITIATVDGKTFNGLIRGENADELTLATGVNQEARIARKDIEEIRPGNVSIMPGGFDQQLTPQELADLVAFLRACK
jgi:putative membrane-bound dehydrogenase-like protein